MQFHFMIHDWLKSLARNPVLQEVGKPIVYNPLNYYLPALISWLVDKPMAVNVVETLESRAHVAPG